MEGKGVQSLTESVHGVSSLLSWEPLLRNCSVSSTWSASPLPKLGKGAARSGMGEGGRHNLD